MERLLTTKELLDFLRISYPTLCRWLNSGQFPCPVNGRGRKLLFRQEAISEWLNRHSQNTDTAGISPAQKMRATKSVKERQASAQAALERHRAGTRRAKQSKGGE